jgi:hypothetical protein
MLGLSSLLSAYKSSFHLCTFNHHALEHYSIHLSIVDVTREQFA